MGCERPWPSEAPRASPQRRQSPVLTAANHEMFRRPPEEQFGSFEELRAAAAEQRKRCRDLDCRERDVLFSESGTVHLGDHAVQPTHYSLTQLATMARVPMALLERLKPETRASVLNQTFPRGRKHKSGLAEGDSLRCINSDRYERVTCRAGPRVRTLP